MHLLSVNLHAAHVEVVMVWLVAEPKMPRMPGWQGVTCSARGGFWLGLDEVDSGSRSEASRRCSSAGPWRS